MQKNMNHERFFEYLRATDEKIKGYFSNSETRRHFRPAHIHDGVFSYLMRPAKRLRPAVMMLSCGCLGGDERSEAILPAAAGVELFHTWTLVHDDIIDNDGLRRGHNTVHVELARRGAEDLGLDEATAEEYGRSAAILTGDVQHGWVAGAFIECALGGVVDPKVVLALLHRLETQVLCDLIYGELRDVQLGLLDIDGQTEITEEDVLEMEWLKTGALYEFSAKAGGMMGKNSDDFEDGEVRALAAFAGNCGIAFQLQDDVLGVVGDEKQLGKPIGSDIREGKKTTIVLQSLRNANEEQRETILSTLGKREATEAGVSGVIDLFKDLGGVDYTRDREKAYIDKALANLDKVPDSIYKELLFSWADFMVNRSL